MLRKNITILIIILSIILLVFFGYVFLSGKSVNNTVTPVVNNFISYFPFGKTKLQTPTNTNPTDISGYTPSTDNTTPQKQKLNRVSSMPIAGFTIYKKEIFKEVPDILPTPATETNPTDTATSPIQKIATKIKTAIKPTAPATEFVPAVKYIAKENGNIYQTLASRIDERRFTTTIIPRVHDAYFGNNGDTVVMRYLKSDNKTIETFVGNLPKEVIGGDTTSDTSVQGIFLPEDITDYSISPDTSKIFYLFNLNENSIGISSDILNNKKSQIFTSAFNEWLTQYPNDKMVTLTAKPSAFAPGYMYSIDPDKKDFNKILSNINGLTTLTSPNGKMVLYGNSNMSLNIYSTGTLTSKTLSMKTLPEKCVWSKNNDFIYCSVPEFLNSGSYPDDWYQGLVSFTDQIWKIDTVTGSGSLIADLPTIGGDIDGTQLATDEGENYLYFVNKKDSYLWELNLK
ncbi:hypothetical protein K8Q94_03535 [Candidatus Nomurabacteria bacterium]|nr:hypothetical protein [Candidatus Nomurabacteria bacterium]